MCFNEYYFPAEDYAQGSFEVQQCKLLLAKMINVIATGKDYILMASNNDATVTFCRLNRN